MEPYRSSQPHAALLLPNTEHLALQVNTLPTATADSVQDNSEICHIIRLSITNSDKLTEKWQPFAEAQAISLPINTDNLIF
jgi:hypothetical protein